MAVHRFQHMFGGSAGQHQIGTLSVLSIATGVSISGGLITFDPTLVHNWSPKNIPNPVNMAGLGNKIVADQWQFTIANGSGGAISADHYVYRKVAIAPDEDQFSIKRNTSGNLEFRCGGELIYTHTMSGTTTYHVIWMFACEDVAESGHMESGGDSDSLQPHLWSALYIDKVLVDVRVINVLETAFLDLIMNSGPGQWGHISGTAGITKTFTVGDVCLIRTDWEDPIGKVTIDHWPFHTGQTPVNDGGTKSSGTDAAALIDESPPSGSGTTDGDYYDIGAGLAQTSDVTDSLLGAGDVLYCVKSMYWARAPGGSATCRARMHDGTAAALQTLSPTNSTSYTEYGVGGSVEPMIHQTARDGAEWSTKTNTNLDLYEWGLTGSVNSTRVDAIYVEAAIVKSGDTITPPPAMKAATKAQPMIFQPGKVAVM